MPRSERIAFVCPRFAEGATVGGAETLLRWQAERAAMAGRSVTFLTTCAENHFTWANDLPAGPKQAGPILVHRFPVDGDRDVGTFLRVQAAISRGGLVSEADERAWIENSVNSRALCRHLEERLGEFDRVVAGPYLFGTTVAAGRIARSKFMLVPCLHDEGFARTGVIRRMFEDSGSIGFNSEPERDLAARLYELKPGRSAVIGMGIPEFDADPGAFAARRGIAEPYIIYSGRREGGKGTPVLMDYFALFRRRSGRPLKLLLTGSGEAHPPDAVRGDVMDLGFLPEEEKREAMAGAVAFCHPSVNESFSIVQLEAFMARTPALVHGMCEVTTFHCRRARAGLWFRTYPEFEECLLRLLDRPGLRAALGNAGRRYVLEHYTCGAVSRRLMAALDGGAA